MFKSVIDRFLGPGSVHKKVAGAQEGACQHMPVQPAPRPGEEGGGEPAGQVQSVPRYKKYKTMAPEE